MPANVSDCCSPDAEVNSAELLIGEVNENPPEDDEAVSIPEVGVKGELLVTVKKGVFELILVVVDVEGAMLQFWNIEGFVSGNRETSVGTCCFTVA